MDKLSAMNMFIRVVETGSFSAVARELNSTQPTISKNIAELESWLGAKLLNRSTRSLRLTETGTDYYERCVNILRDVEEAEQVVGQLQTQPRGTVRISSVAAFGRLHIIPRLPEFFEQYPDIRVDVRLSDRVVDLVEAGVDVAFRMGSLSDSSLIARKLCSSPMLTVATPDYLRRHGIPAHPGDLREHIYLAYSESGSTEVTYQDEGKPYFVRVQGNMVTNSSEALRAGLLAGLGVSRAPSWLIGDLVASGELVKVLAEYQQQDVMDIHGIYSPGRHLPLKVRAFLDFFSQAFRDCSIINGEQHSEQKFSDKSLVADR